MPCLKLAPMLPAPYTAPVKRLFLLLFMVTATLAGAWQPVNENAPEPAREFRAAWVATVFNLDWPSKAGLPATSLCAPWSAADCA